MRDFKDYQIEDVPYRKKLSFNDMIKLNTNKNVDKICCYANNYLEVLISMFKQNMGGKDKKIIGYWRLNKKYIFMYYYK